MKRLNKYILLAIISSCFFILFWLLSINKKTISYNDNYPLEVIDNEIRIKETGEVLYRFIPVDGGKMAFEYIDTLIYDDQVTLHHSHCIKDIPSFLIGETPVTYRLWNYVMNGMKTIEKNDIQNFFVIYRDSVSAGGWNQFIRELNGLTGKKFSLPSSFQWEYAARGGLKDNGYRFSGSDDIDEVALYKSNSFQDFVKRAGKKKKSNELGLYDMSGNVWELTTTNYTEIFPSSRMFLEKEESFRMGICRGGDWQSPSEECSVSYIYRGCRLYSGARLILLTGSEPLPVQIQVLPSVPYILDESVDKVVGYPRGPQHIDGV